MAKYVGKGATIFCLKTVLLLFNFIIWSSGIALLVAGIWMKMTMTPFLTLSTDYSNSVPFSFIGIGVVITVIGFLACFCTVKGHTTLLYLLSIFFIVVFFMEVGVAVAGYTFRRNIENSLRDGLRNAMEQYGEKTKQDNNLDFIQKHIKCCGVYNFTDWYDTKWGNEHNGTVPKSCCKEDVCDTAIQDEIYVKGCYEQLIDYIKSKMGIIAGVAVGFACVQVLAAILACCLAKRTNKIRYEAMS